jgi:hypothetical protein
MLPLTIGMIIIGSINFYYQLVALSMSDGLLEKLNVFQYAYLLVLTTPLQALVFVLTLIGGWILLKPREEEPNTFARLQAGSVRTPFTCLHCAVSSDASEAWECGNCQHKNHAKGIFIIPANIFEECRGCKEHATAFQCPNCSKHNVIDGAEYLKKGSNIRPSFEGVARFVGDEKTAVFDEYKTHPSSTASEGFFRDI